MVFDLFKLHDIADISNCSWICFKGPNLHKIVEELRRELISKYNLSSTKKLCEIVAKRLNCEMWTVGQVLYRHKDWIPIPLLHTLINMTNNPLGYKQRILKDVTYLKCNSAKSKPVKAVKNLSVTLCKIAGAHAADGSIFSAIGVEVKRKEKANKILKVLKKYRRNAKIYKTCNRIRIAIKNVSTEKILEELSPFTKNKDITIWLKNGINLTEGSKKATSAFKEWIKDAFGIDAKLTAHGKKKAWRVDLDNKIMVRYLTKFLDFPSGSKTYTVKEPAIIKNSEVKFRRSFLLGLLTFEGYVPGSGNMVQVLSKSRDLIASAKEILSLLEIPTRGIKKDFIDRWICESKVLHGSELRKILNILERGTEKWQRINYKIEGFQYKCKSVEEAKEILKKTFPRYATSKIGILDLFDRIKTLRSASFKLLENAYCVNKSTLRRYLEILNRANIVSIVNLSRKRTIIFNEDLNEWRLPNR